MEWYRSGHNELHWNCSSRETGPWVRIPPIPPEIVTFKTFENCYFLFFNEKVCYLSKVVIWVEK